MVHNRILAESSCSDVVVGSRSSFPIPSARHYSTNLHLDQAETHTIHTAKAWLFTWVLNEKLTNTMTYYNTLPSSVYYWVTDRFEPFLLFQMGADGLFIKELWASSWVDGSLYTTQLREVLYPQFFPQKKEFITKNHKKIWRERERQRRVVD